MARTITCRPLTRLGPDDLVLCSGTIRAAPFAHTVSAASAAGFQGVSLYYDEYAIARAEGWTDADMRALLDDNGVAVAEIDGRMDWLPDDWGAPSVADFLTAAAALGARSITVLETRGRRVGTDIPLDVVVERSAPSVIAPPTTACWSTSSTSRGRGSPRSSSAHEIAGAADRSNGGVMVDVWHHVRGPDQGVARRGGDLRIGARGAGERRRHEPATTTSGSRPCITGSCRAEARAVPARCSGPCAIRAASRRWRSRCTPTS